MCSSQPSQAGSRREILAIVAGLMFAMFLGALDQTIVASALPRIAADLRGENHVGWVVSIYLLTSTPATPLYGKLSDLYGRKVMLQTAIAVFLAASVLCGIATSVGQLIAYRALQGLGGGGLMAVAHATIADVVSPRERGRYQGYFATVFAAASILGPVLGSLSVGYLTWRWVFWINIPLGFAALLVSQLTLKRLVAEGRRSEIDYAGAMLLVAAVGCVLLVTTMGSKDVAWVSPIIVGSTVAGVGLFALLVIQERRAAEPVMPPRMFKESIFVIANAVTLIASAGMLGLIVFTPMFMQLVYQLPSTDSGWMLIPLNIAATLGSIGASRLVVATGRYRLIAIAGLLGNVAGMLLMSTITNATPLILAAIYLALSGLGLGMVMPVMLVAVQNVVKADDIGVGTASIDCFRAIGGSLGVAVFGSVFMARLASHSEALGKQDALGGDPALALLHAGAKAPELLPPELHDAVFRVFAQALDDMFLAGAFITAIALVLSLPLREKYLDEKAAHTNKGRAQSGEPRQT